MQVALVLRRAVVGLFVCAAPLMNSAARAAQKPFVIEDIYRLEVLGEAYRFSPDGRYIAFMRKRSVEAEPQRYFLFSNDRADMWLLDRTTGVQRNLTNGAKARADYWYPAWSPDGNRLAMVATAYADRGYSHLWVWDRTTDQFTQVGERFVDLDNDDRTNTSENRIHWVSNSQLIFPSMPAGVKPIEPRTGRQHMYEIMNYWNTALQGEKSTAVTFESGVVIPKPALVKGKTYVSCAVDSGQCIDVVEAYAAGMHDFLGAMSLPAPDGQLIAAMTIEEARIPNPISASQRYTSNIYGIHLFDKTGERVLESLSRMKNVAPASMRWSQDGRRLAFIGSFDPDWNFVPAEGCQDTRHFGVFILDVKSGRLESFDISTLRPIVDWRWGFHCSFNLTWAADRLLLKAEGVAHPTADKARFSQAGWWSISSDKRPANLTEQLGFTPEALYPALDGRALVFAHEGNIWLLTANGKARQLTQHPRSPKLVLNIVWKEHNTFRSGGINQLIYELRDLSTTMLDGGRTTVHHVNLKNGRITDIPVPAGNATFAGFSPVANEAVFTQNNRTGTRMFLSGLGADAAKSVIETNTLLQGIAEGEVRSFEYTSLRGEKLTAGLILPVGYQQGKQYPLVTWVYQRAVQKDRHLLSSIATINPLNLQPLASRGYAILFPSMPGKMKEYDKLLNGVLPAVDKAIEMGFADPERLAVMGQSNGGYSTYGLVTLTPRFKAAIALAGMSDLSSIVLQFEDDYLSPQAVETGVTAGRFALKESGHGFGLPWKSNLYALNSPLTYIEKVQTPILQLHGDLDGAPIQQAQAFFLGMQRLGKRAKLVQYMGDDHVLQSPANVRHSWQEIFSWLNTYVTDASTPK